MWEVRNASSIQGREPKVISTALFEDPFPDYIISPALVSLVAKHAPQDIDLFEHVLRSFKDLAHILPPEVDHLKEDFKAGSEWQCRNEETTETARLTVLPPCTVRQKRNQIVSKKLSSFPPETHRRTPGGTRLLPSGTVLESRIQKFEEGKGELLSPAIDLRSPGAMEKATRSVQETLNSSTSCSATMTSLAMYKIANIDKACDDETEELEEVAIDDASNDIRSTSCTRNHVTPQPNVGDDSPKKEGVDFVKSIDNHSKETCVSIEASALHKPIKLVQASHNSLPTSRRAKGKTCRQNENVKSPKIVTDGSSIERLSVTRGSEAKPWRNGMKPVERSEDDGTTSRTKTERKASDFKDERSLIMKNKQRVKDFDLKRRLEIQKEHVRCEKHQSYLRPPWDSDCTLPCLDGVDPWTIAAEMEAFDINFPVLQRSCMESGPVYMQPRSNEKTYCHGHDCDDLHNFCNKNKGFFNQGVSIKKLDLVRNKHLLEMHLRRTCPDSQQTNDCTWQCRRYHPVNHQYDKERATWKNSILTKNGGNMLSTLPWLPSKTGRKKQTQTGGHQKQRQKHFEKAHKLPKKKVNTKKYSEVCQNGPPLVKLREKIRSVPPNKSVVVLPPHITESSDENGGVHISTVNLEEHRDIKASIFKKNKSTFSRNFSPSSNKPRKEIARGSVSASSKSTTFAGRRSCHQEKQEKCARNSVSYKKIQQKNNSFNFTPTSKEESPIESPSNVSQAAICRLQQMPLLKVLLQQLLKCVNAACSCLNNSKNTQLDLTLSAEGNQGTVEAISGNDNNFDFSAEKCSQFLSESRTDIAVTELLSLEKVFAHMDIQGISVSSSFLSRSLSNKFALWKKNLDLSESEQAGTVPDYIKLPQQDEQCNNDTGLYLQFGCNELHTVSNICKRGVEVRVINDKKITRECYFILFPIPGNGQVVTSEAKLEAFLTHLKILDSNPHPGSNHISTSLENCSTEASILEINVPALPENPYFDRIKLDKEDDSTQKKKWSLPEKGDPLSVINIYKRHWVCKGQQKVNFEDLKLNEMGKSEDANQISEESTADKNRKNINEATPALSTDESSNCFIPLSNGTGPVSSEACERTQMAAFEKTMQIVSTPELIRNSSDLDLFQSNLLHSKVNSEYINQSGNEEPLEVPNRLAASFHRRCGIFRKHRFSSLDKKQFVTSMESNMRWARLQSSKQRYKLLKRRKHRQKEIHSALLSACFTQTSSRKYYASVMTRTTGNYSVGIDSKGTVAPIEEDFQSIVSSTNGKNHLHDRDCQQMVEKQCQADPVDDRLRQSRIALEEEAKAPSSYSHLSSDLSLSLCTLAFYGLSHVCSYIA